MSMKFIGIVVILFIALQIGISQEQMTIQLQGHKGEFYFYWGWNRGAFTQSDISFHGADYDFTLQNVVAKDRQTPFSVKKHLNPSQMTIPQYNFRLGYFINDHYNISIGTDHMKYVMQADQTVKISGEINGTGTDYDGIYDNDDIVLTKYFLQFEHTDGLNYPNIELRRLDEIFARKNIRINITEGFGIGVLYPRTNTTLLGKERYDEFHLAGYGLAAVVGLNVSIFKHLFVQTEVKGGYINMPDIRTTMSEPDKASQHFFFGQWNYVIGGRFDFGQK